MELAGAKHYFDASSGFLKTTVQGGALLLTISQLIEVITKLDFIRHPAPPEPWPPRFPYAACIIASLSAL